MSQYIDKDALVAEIKRRRKLVSDPILSGDDLMIGERNALFNLLSFINTLEVKEVDLKETLQAEYKKGRFDMREEMMKDSIETQVYPTERPDLVEICQYGIILDGTKFQPGDKVKIVIIKSEQQ